MTVSNAADTIPQEPKKPEPGMAFTQVNDVRAVRTYQKAEQQVMVTDSDLTGQNIELKPEKVAGAADGADGGGR
jgi:hypothetical protein